MNMQFYNNTDDDNIFRQSSYDRGSMSPYRNIHKYNRGNHKDNKHIYNTLRIRDGKSDKRKIRHQRVRGRINPPRRRMERHKKLSSLFAYERYMEKLDREHDFFQKEIARDLM